MKKKKYLGVDKETVKVWVYCSGIVPAEQRECSEYKSCDENDYCIHNDCGCEEECTLMGKE